MSKKVGVITMHRGLNFGSALQSYALQQAIKSVGKEPWLIDFMPSGRGRLAIVVHFLRNLLTFLSPSLRIKNHYVQDKFVNSHNRLTSFAYDSESLAKVTSHLDTIVCGSDQIWAPNLFRDVFMASFANPSQRKVSYAASIGLDDIPDNMIERYRKNLSSFYAIGIREFKGQEILQNRCGIRSEVVLDPTLLNKAGIYRDIETEVKGINKPFVFCYFLNKNHTYRERVEKFAKEKGLKIIGVSFSSNDDDWMNNLKGLGANHFLWLIDHSECAFTDSYHCTIFSLLFHKSFYLFERFLKTDVICQNSRIQQLDQYFNISSRILSPIDTVVESSIDYVYFENELEKLRKSSYSFLSKALA